MSDYGNHSRFTDHRIVGTDHRIVGLIISPLFCRAYDFEFWQDGELRTARLVPVPMQHCSDLMEAYLVGNLQGIRSQMPIVRTMVPRNALANIVEEFQPRTEAGMAQVAHAPQSTFLLGVSVSSLKPGHTTRIMDWHNQQNLSQR